MNRIANQSASDSLQQSPAPATTNHVVRVGGQSYQVAGDKMHQSRTRVSLIVLVCIEPAVLSIFFALLVGILGDRF